MSSWKPRQLVLKETSQSSSTKQTNNSTSSSPSVEENLNAQINSKLSKIDELLKINLGDNGSINNNDNSQHIIKHVTIGSSSYTTQEINPNNKYKSNTNSKINNNNSNNNYSSLNTFIPPVTFSEPKKSILRSTS